MNEFGGGPMLSRKVIVWGSSAAGALGLLAVIFLIHHISQPSAKLLAKYGMHVQLAVHARPSISRTRADAIVKHGWPLSQSTPMATELVEFSNRHVMALRTPQLAWLITWDATSYPVGGRNRNGSGQNVSSSPYHHMNEVINARTGKILEAFPSP